MAGEKTFKSLEEFEDAVDPLLHGLGKRLPIEIILNHVRGATFQRDGDNYYCTNFNVAHIPYFVSIRKEGALSLWRLRPQNNGSEIGQYKDPRVAELFAEVERREVVQAQVGYCRDMIETMGSQSTSRFFGSG